MVLPRPGALEMTLTDGSSWLTYAPTSWNRPPQLPPGIGAAAEVNLDMMPFRGFARTHNRQPSAYAEPW
jgi:hypothetical protein